MCYPFTVPESLEDHRCLLVSEEDGSVFLLIVDTGEACAGHRPVVSVSVSGVAPDAHYRDGAAACAGLVGAHDQEEDAAVLL